jgi:hypothetical protein
MISARQLKNILDNSFSSNSVSGFAAPTAILTATPDYYYESDTPISVTIDGVITPNDGVSITWDLRDSSNVSLISGFGNTISHVLLAEPTTVGVYTYTLIIDYQDANGSNFTTNATVNVTVLAKTLVGQLALPGDDITIPGDLTPAIEGTLTDLSQLQSINLFTITAVNTGRIVIVVPDSFGTLLDISDNTDSSVLSEFNTIVDASNSRKIYVSKLALTPAVYRYKLVY